MRCVITDHIVVTVFCKLRMARNATTPTTMVATFVLRLVLLNPLVPVAVDLPVAVVGEEAGGEG
jgi:hypothetical protein